MREHARDKQPDYSQSYDYAKGTDDEVFFKYGSIPRTNGRIHNFENSQNDLEELRNRSVSLPYVAACNSRMYKRSLSSLETQGSINSRSKLRASSTGNINDSGESSGAYSSSGEEEDKAKDILCFGFTKRQVKCGAALCLISVTDVMGFSIFSPFFPVVAEEKGMSEFQIGLIFAAFSMAGIFASILTGTLLVRVGAKFIILSGLFWSAGATMCFGLLDRASTESFFYLCFVCRIVMGIGNAAAFTALFAVIFQEFADRALTMIGISESLCAIGGIIGPLLGGAMYDLGGYVVPFAFLGGLNLLVLVLSAIAIPSVAVERQASAVSPAWLLLNLHGLFSALFVILSFAVNSFITANFSLFLIHSFDISTFMVGVFMLVFSVFYGLSTPIWGYIAEKYNAGAHMMTGSCFLTGIVLSLLGPADFWMKCFGWTVPHKWLVIVCTGFLGTLMGALIMPTFGEMLIAAKQMKLQSNELAEYGLVSGLWNTMFAVGDIMGPTAGGALVAKFDFNGTCALFGLMISAMALLKTVHLVVLGWRARHPPRDEVESSEENKDRDSEERTNLLNPDDPSVQ